MPFPYQYQSSRETFAYHGNRFTNEHVGFDFSDLCKTENRCARLSLDAISVLSYHAMLLRMAEFHPIVISCSACSDESGSL